jgi:hypothetical protein
MRDGLPSGLFGARGDTDKFVANWLCTWASLLVESKVLRSLRRVPVWPPRAKEASQLRTREAGMCKGGGMGM